MIPYITTVRGIMFVSIVLAGLAIFVIFKNSQEKTEYEMKTGQIEYFEHNYLDLPIRNHGDYRYLKIDSYKYVFEIYIPNSNLSIESIDNLRIGDTIQTYFYETDFTHTEKINRYIQFIDKNNNPYFERNNFQKQLGFVIYGIVILMNIFAFILWKRGKLEW